MKKIDRVYEDTFNTLDDMNEWINEQPFDVMIINILIDVYKGASLSGLACEYILFYGKIKEEE